MGHQVTYLGAFTVTPPVDPGLLRWLDEEFILDPWAAAAHRGLPLDLTSNCTWWTGDGDGSRLSWTGAEKSYDGRAWLQWLLDHVLGPAGHSAHGTVHRFAEPAPTIVEVSRIVADEDGITEVPFPSERLPWRDHGPMLADAFFHLGEGSSADAQSTLLRWLDRTPLATQPGLVAFLDEVAEYWPDPIAVRTALADASTPADPRTDAAISSPPHRRDAGGKRSFWHRRGR